MRNDLERLMEQRGLDGMAVLGSSLRSAALRYLVNGADLGDSWFLAGRGGKRHLIHNPMERDAAAGAGVELSTPADNDFPALADRSDSIQHAWGRMLGERLKKMGISGSLALYGVADVGLALEVRRTLEDEYGHKVVGDMRLPLTDELRYTKDMHEIEILRGLSKITCEVMGRLRDHLALLKPSGGKLAGPDGSVARIGDLRRIVRMGFAERGLIQPHGSIIAQGRDAGVPHNHGNDAEEIRSGAPIVVDIFPQDTASGYYYDMTRTFCVGPAPQDLRELFVTVHDAHLAALDTFTLGSLARDYQHAVCDYFESRGHATLRKDDRAEEGYVHSLGHGLGLDLHERPRFSASPMNTDALLPGTVFTVEPGLYYPSRGLGVRLEDVVVAHGDGTFENLTDFPLTLEV